jgi:hypothetical protein
MTTHQSFVPVSTPSWMLECFMFDAAPSMQWGLSPQVPEGSVIRESPNSHAMSLVYQSTMQQLGTPQPCYGTPQPYYGMSHPEQAFDLPPEEAQQHPAHCDAVAGEGAGQRVDSLAQKARKVIQNQSVKKVDQGVESSGVGEDAAGANLERSAQKPRKGIRNKAIRKTNDGFEIVDAIPMSPQAAAILLEGEQRSTHDLAIEKADEESRIQLVDEEVLLHHERPHEVRSAGASSTEALNSEPVSDLMLECSGTSDWMSADVSSSCAAGPPGLGRRRSYRSPAKRNRDIARLHGRDFGQAPTAISGIEEQECKEYLQDSSRNVCADEDELIEQSSMDTSTGQADASDELSPLSISAMLKWRAVVLGEGLSENVVVCSAMRIASKDPVPKSWREEAALSQQTKKQQKGRGKGTKENQSTNCWSTQLQQGLIESENSWSAKQKQLAKNSDSEEKSDEEIVRLMKSILNKITMKKYDTLYQQLLDCGMSTVEHVKILIDEVLEKAETQHHFIQMYCQLCMDLHKWFVECDSTESVDKREARAKCFRHILLTRCQTKFQDNLLPLDLNAVKEEDEGEAVIKHKHAVLGNIKFIAGLLENRMLNDVYVIRIAWELCDDSAMRLESLAAFLTAVGASFDQPDFVHHEHLQEIFMLVEEKSQDKSVAARIRFLFRDLLDLRKVGWSSSSSSSQT